MILNFAACVPVVCSVGIFSIYHWWSLIGNTTTIEAWEKDKVGYFRPGSREGDDEVRYLITSPFTGRYVDSTRQDQRSQIPICKLTRALDIVPSDPDRRHPFFLIVSTESLPDDQHLLHSRSFAYPLALARSENDRIRDPIQDCRRIW